ncbi:hypothetical protein ACTI_31540 [Actinoplanes sp. OR16]|uniref:site-specific integrase n=1 Tax=Actinoplanes sp. OR16 TaxID=946334 RepID=UPI000F6DF5FB|nr:site-specific integrase [Actinoplanes sp. OR16]BBH66469.1 hypothetical protein ACTI_31540 [Actinoplanes sp. OR16]
MAQERSNVGITDGDPRASASLPRVSGLRRGEACGLRWEDVDLRGRTMTVAIQLVDNDGEVAESEPKSDAGNRMVALDVVTVSVLRSHRLRQQEAQLKAGEAWLDSGRVFTQANGAWVEPDWLSDHFDRLVRRSELPPIRLHDLRHGAATLALAAGVDMKVVQDMLGHSSYALTSDTYTSVLPEVAQSAAEAAARLIPRQKAKKTAGLTSGSQTPGTPAKGSPRARTNSKKQQVKAAS